MLFKPIPGTTWKVGQPNTLVLPPHTFLDVDDDALTFGGSFDGQALPNWLNVDSSNGTVHGTPPSTGSYRLRLMAIDETRFESFGVAFVELDCTSTGLMV